MTSGIQGKLDGIPVTVYDGKFAGTFPLDQEVGQDIHYDDEVTFLVTTVSGKALFGATKVGDLRRTNTFEVVSVVPLAPDLAQKLNAEALEALSDDTPALEPQFEFDDSSGDFLDDTEEEFDVEIASPGADIVSNDVSYKDPALKNFLEVG